MPSHFSIIRYVPDPVADERINVGVVATDEAGVHLRFLTHWERVRQFAEKDVKFLRQFAKDLKDRQLVLGIHNAAWTHERLASYAAEWRHSIQFSEPQGSVRPAAELVAVIARRFLVEAVAQIAAYQTRTDAIQLGIRAVRAALRAKVGPITAREYLKNRYALAGARSVHHFDIVAANGQPIFASQALSLQVPDQRKVEKDINSAGWALRDLRNLNKDFPTSILAILPAENVVDAATEQNIKRVKSVSDELSIPLFLSDVQLQSWAGEHAGSLQ